MTSRELPTLYVVTWFFERQPGLAIYRQRLRSLQQRYRVVLVCRSPDTPQRLGLPELTAHCVAMPDQSYTHILQYCRHVSRWLAKQPAGDVFLMTSALAMMALLIDGRRISLYWNEMPSHVFPKARYNLIKRAAHAWLRKMMYQGALDANCVMPISPFMQQDLIQRGRSAEATPVIDMGVDEVAPLTQAQVEPQGPLELIYPGSLTDERCREELIDAVFLARQQGHAVRLTYVGASDADQQQLGALMARRGDQGALRVLGLLPHHEVMQLVAASHLGVTLLRPLPHYQFNPPTKLFEFLACGVPVLHNDLRTLTHYVKDGETGLLTDITAEGIARTLAHACTHREALARMGAQCRATGQRYEWQQVAPQFLAALGAA